MKKMIELAVLIQHTIVKDKTSYKILKYISQIKFPGELKNLLENANEDSNFGSRFIEFE